MRVSCRFCIILCVNPAALPENKLIKMNNLFICLTPLQALIAQQLIRQTAPTPADLLMICYAEADNEKFRHYYHETAALCRHAEFIRVPQNLWLREIALFSLTKNLQKQYDTIYAASIDNPNVQFPLSHVQFNRLETFDDGTANLYPTSILYRNQYYGTKAKLIRKLQGICYTTEDLRALSTAHHTLYPTQKNIVSPTIALNLWQNNEQHSVSDNDKLDKNVQKILLGQPFFDNEQENTQLFNQIIELVKPDHYFPHPRETYQLNTNYINTSLIFEDYLLKNIRPDTEYHIYHIASTAALNVSNFPNVKIHALRPKHDYFQQENFRYLYDLMKNMQIEIHEL